MINSGLYLTNGRVRLNGYLSMLLESMTSNLAGSIVCKRVTTQLGPPVPIVGVSMATCRSRAKYMLLFMLTESCEQTKETGFVLLL